MKTANKTRAWNELFPASLSVGAIVLVILAGSVSAGVPSIYGLGGASGGPGQNYHSFFTANGCASGTPVCTVNGCTNTAYTSSFTLLAGTTPPGARAAWDFCASATGKIPVHGSQPEGFAEMDSVSSTNTWLWSNGTGIHTLTFSADVTTATGALHVQGTCPAGGGGGIASAQVSLIFVIALYTNLGSLVFTGRGVFNTTGPLSCDSVPPSSSYSFAYTGLPITPTSGGSFSAFASTTLVNGQSYYATLTTICNATAFAAGGSSYAECDVSPYPTGFVDLLSVVVT